MKVGILALQGCIAPHIAMLSSLGVDAVEVKDAQGLEKIDRLILPGGESTTMLKFLKWNKMDKALRDFGANKPMWGVCAGAILLAKTVENPEQESLDLIDVKATRNFYGSHHGSFETEVKLLPLQANIKVQFIRAPKLSPLSENVECIAMHNDEGVAFCQRNILVSAFHTELLSSPLFHHYFCSLT